MNRIVRAAFVCICAGVGLQAQNADPSLPGYFRLSSDQSRQFRQSLRPKMNEYKQAADELADFGNQTAWVAHREADGLAEIHEKWTDLMFVVSGEAALLLGGTVSNSRTEAQGEMRGSAIQGGQKRAIREGDVVRVPAGMPHQFLVTKGKEITFFTMKIAK